MLLNANNLDEHIGERVKCVIENSYATGELKEVEGILDKDIVKDCNGDDIGEEGMYIVVYDTRNENGFTHFTFSEADMGDNEFLRSIETI